MLCRVESQCVEHVGRMCVSLSVECGGLVSAGLLRGGAVKPK